MSKRIKKIRKTTKEQEQLITRLCLIDDTFFETFAKDPDAVEELLQIFLENPKLKIKRETLKPQKGIHVVGRQAGSLFLKRANLYMTDSMKSM